MNSRPNRFILHALTLPFALFSSTLESKEVPYQLTIAKMELNVTGKSVPAMTINGGIPGPTLEFTNGDTAVIEVTNQMDVPTSVHWHGLLVPPQMDGVPGISFPAIKPHTSFTYGTAD